MEIGKDISKLRKNRGLNQRELASAIGVTTGAIGMWETNKRQPDLATVIKLAEYFNCSTDYLLGVTDDINPSANDNTSLNFTNENQKFIDLFAELNEANKDIIVGDMRRYIKEQNAEKLVNNPALMSHLSG